MAPRCYRNFLLKISLIAFLMWTVMLYNLTNWEPLIRGVGHLQNEGEVEAFLNDHPVFMEHLMRKLRQQGHNQTASKVLETLVGKAKRGNEPGKLPHPNMQAEEGNEPGKLPHPNLQAKGGKEPRELPHPNMQVEGVNEPRKLLHPNMQAKGGKEPRELPHPNMQAKGGKEPRELPHPNLQAPMQPLKPPQLDTGPGERGEPVHISEDQLSPEEQAKYKEGTRLNGYSGYVSDLISLHRSLPDFRDEKCREPHRYPDNLPSSSVILCFHDESWSALLRSVHSILDRTPEHLLTEVILVDDFSQLEHLKKPLEEYVAQYPKVKLIRTNKHEGLTRARIIGAKAATGQVLTFLDSHIECSKGWLEPLVETIRKNPKASVVPVIETINDETFEMKSTSCELNSIGGFDWTLTFDWHAVPKRIQDHMNDPCDPIPSPTMAGGLFSIGKDFFEELGYYDRHLDVWGGENLELSFKIWMCGGELYQVPCSHIGHVFRKENPYAKKSSVQFGNFVRKNTMRVAEVWLDEYKEIYYQRSGGKKPTDNIGDLSEAIKLREDLKCKSFDWFLKNIYPEVYVPGKGPAYGEVQNLGVLPVPYCLDSLGNKIHKPVGVYNCHKMGGNQFWGLTELGEIRNDRGCVDNSGSKELILYPCHQAGGNQLWIYRLERKQLFHKMSKKCLAIDKGDLKDLKLTLSGCSPLNGFNQWSISKMNETLLADIEKKLL